MHNRVCACVYCATSSRSWKTYSRKRIRLMDS